MRRPHQVARNMAGTPQTAHPSQAIRTASCLRRHQFQSTWESLRLVIRLTGLEPQGAPHGCHAHHIMMTLAEGAEAAACLVQHLPDGVAGLVDGGNDGVAQRCEAGHVVHDVERCKGVQPRGGLVQEQQRRLRDQRARNAQPALLSACSVSMRAWFPWKLSSYRKHIAKASILRAIRVRTTAAAPHNRPQERMLLITWLHSLLRFVTASSLHKEVVPSAGTVGCRQMGAGIPLRPRTSRPPARMPPTTVLRDWLRPMTASTSCMR